MARRTRFDLAFAELRQEFRSRAKRAFFRDIEGQLEEDDAVREIMGKPLREGRYLTVSFDRRLNDSTFSYSEFDLILVILDAISGGAGIYKPVSQLRVLRWNGSRDDLRTVLLYLRGLNPKIQFYRLLILPYPANVMGYRVYRGIYRK